MTQTSGCLYIVDVAPGMRRSMIGAKREELWLYVGFERKGHGHVVYSETHHIVSLEYNYAQHHKTFG